MSRENYNQVENNLSTEVKAFAKTRYGNMSALARAMQISPQHLHGYLSGSKAWGSVFVAKLQDAGFISKVDDRFNSGLKASGDIQLQDSKEPFPLYLDIAGAMELTRSPAKRLAQLIQVAPGTLEAWESGEASPTMAQLGTLFNQVVALGLARCAEHDRRPAVLQERRAAAG